MPVEMKYGAVRWRQEAAERGHGDPASKRATDADPDRRFHYTCPAQSE